jgi:hypothetical protein
MTEALTALQLFFLRRAAAAGYVRVGTAEERATLDELLEKNLYWETNSLMLDGVCFGKPDQFRRRG